LFRRVNLGPTHSIVETADRSRTRAALRCGSVAVSLYKPKRGS